MTDNILREIRVEKLKKLQSLGIDPYPVTTKRTHTITEALANEGKSVAVVGRMMSYREHGNIAFADLLDETGKIQIFFQKKVLGDNFKTLKLFDIGDFLQVEGLVGKTIAGEVSVIPVKMQLLSKSLRPLPNEWYGIKDTETRYRQRYLDLLLNGEVRDRFNLRTKLVSGIREYLDQLGFWEVETPTLQTLYGGANAKPFTTHLNALDQDMYLRIADELYLKRLIVGGYEKVYEICKDFRNEGIDQTHLPEFTMIEWYETYADYHVMMDRAEGMIKTLTKKLFSTTTLQVGEDTVDMSKKWPRIPMDNIIKEKLGLDVETETIESLLAYAKKHLPDIQIVGGETKGQLIFAIFDHTIPKLLKEPTWIIDYPQDISPLSKPHRNKKGWVERFEGYVGGKEIFDGWSELTDPQIQRAMLTKDENAARKDTEEAQHVDEEFLSAMEYGMPPFGGIGVGIDRLVMLFSNTWMIKEVVLFPSLRKEKKQTVEDRKKKIVIATGIARDDNPEKTSLTREDAYTLLMKHLTTKNLIRHSLATEATMRLLARYFGADEEKWGITGLLHDVDWDLTKNDVSKHGTLILQDDPRVPQDIVHAVKSHNYTYTGIVPETKMDWAITCCDELTGIIVASALIHPDKEIAALDTDFVLKRFNSSSFAKGAHREVIAMCKEKLGIALPEFIDITLKAMQNIADQLGFSQKKEWKLEDNIQNINKMQEHDKQDFSKKMVIVVNKDLPQWQVLNTIAHISAYLGNKMGANFDTGESFNTKDSVFHPRNTQYPIIVLTGKTEQLAYLAAKARESDLLYHGFIREMIETTDDQEIEKKLVNKTEADIEYLGVGVFGPIDAVDILTKKYSLWK